MLDSSFHANHRRRILKVHDPEKIVVVYDHIVPAPDRPSAEGHVYGREFVKQFGIKRFHDVGRDQGISHAVVADHGYALPGTVLVCSRFAHLRGRRVQLRRARRRRARHVYAPSPPGKTWFQVGETVRYDLARHSCGRASRPRTSSCISRGTYGDHANQNIEFGGPGLAHLGINARRTLATMGAELSAEFATFEADQTSCSTTCERAIRRRSKRNIPTPMRATSTRRTIDLDAMEPLVALPDAVIRNSVRSATSRGETIQQAFIGSCANGTLDDLAEAARRRRRASKSRRACASS